MPRIVPLSLIEDGRISLGENPYWLFISFLYSVIAVNIAERFSQVAHDWKGYNCAKLLPVSSHLTLAGFVVGTSFLGWTQAFGSQITTSPKIISLWALMVAIDFTILAMYFILVSTVGDHRQGKCAKAQNTDASYWIRQIFLAYVVWDTFAYLVLRHTPDSPVKEGSFLDYSWMSFVCTLLAILAHEYFKGLKSASRIVVADVSLISLVLLYRSLKQMAFCPPNHDHPCPKFPDPVSIQIDRLFGGDGGWLSLFILGFFLAFLLTGLLSRGNALCALGIDLPSE